MGVCEGRLGRLRERTQVRRRVACSSVGVVHRSGGGGVSEHRKLSFFLVLRKRKTRVQARAYTARGVLYGIEQPGSGPTALFSRQRGMMVIE